MPQKRTKTASNELSMFTVFSILYNREVLKIPTLFVFESISRIDPCYFKCFLITLLFYGENNHHLLQSHEHSSCWNSIRDHVFGSLGDRLNPKKKAAFHQKEWKLSVHLHRTFLPNVFSQRRGFTLWCNKHSVVCKTDQEQAFLKIPVKRNSSRRQKEMQEVHRAHHVRRIPFALY
jgi:hypothetical protein